MIAFLDATWSVLLALAPWLFLGALASALLYRFLPPGFMRRALTGRFAVAKAVLFGVPLPLCSCGVIPAGIGLRRQGASRGASVGFLIATPQTGVDSTLVAASMLGWPFALFKVAAALVTGLFGGHLAERFGGADEGASEDAGAADGPRSWRAAFEHALELIESIWGWLAFGVLTSAAITTWLPPASLPSAGAGALLAMLGALLISLPLYVCATASVPIAAALVASGMPPGAALVFLMAGPATNIATLGAIRGAFGARTTAIYLAVLIVASLGFGLAYGALFELDVTTMAHHHEGAWWQRVSAGALLVMLAGFALRDTVSAIRARRAPTLSVRILEVEGLTCGGCARKLTRTLEATEGVAAVRVAHEEGEAHVEGSAPIEALEAAVAEAGFTYRGLRADA